MSFSCKSYKKVPTYAWKKKEKRKKLVAFKLLWKDLRAGGSPSMQAAGSDGGYNKSLICRK